MDNSSAFTPSTLERWRRRENLVPGLSLLALAGTGWVYVGYQAASGGEMRGAAGSMVTGSAGGIVAFLPAWTMMMVAMMVPATLPLILLYRTLARKSLGRVGARTGTAVLLAGYIAVWAVVGLPVYAYASLSAGAGLLGAVVPALLLIVGGAYQFTPLKRVCHARCGSPMSFLMRTWRPGATGALRLGAIHGLDCLGCCLGLMAGLVALGMMDLLWMLTASVVIFVEKTVPGSHYVARPLGVLMVAGGLVLLGVSLLAGVSPGADPM